MVVGTLTRLCMKKLPFVKYSPGGNPTILIRNVRLSPEERAKAANELMHSLHVGAEQVGYANTLSDPPHLEMMGGEFCINAARSMAVLLAQSGRLHPASENRLCGQTTVSGTDAPLLLTVRPLAHEALFEAAVRLEYARPPLVEDVAPEIRLVRLPGITHLVLNARRAPASATPETTAAELRARFNLEQEPAVGCIWTDRTTGRITPVVWVRNTNSICRETACGSGTLAAALAGALPCRDGRFSAVQPSGEILEVEMIAPGKGWQAWISGPVHVVAEGEAYVASLD